MSHRGAVIRSLGLVAALALTACASSDATADDGPAPAEESAQLDPYACFEDDFREAHLEFCLDSFSAHTPLTTGPATEPATFDNGLVGRILSVSTAESAAGTYPVEPGHDALVRIVVEISNEGALPFAFPDEDFLVRESLLYGAAHHEAQQGGAKQYMAARHELTADDGGAAGLPPELAPGASATTTSLFRMPSAELDELTFLFNPSRRILPDWTFSAVAQLLR